MSPIKLTYFNIVSVTWVDVVLSARFLEEQRNSAPTFIRIRLSPERLSVEGRRIREMPSCYPSIPLRCA